MNILIITCGKESGEIRGHQLGKALGARVSHFPIGADLAWANVVVLIKQAGAMWTARVQASGKPIVWDALDFWDQPAQNDIDENTARGHLLRYQSALHSALTICATQAMAEACNGVYLSHHARPGLMPQPVRETVTTVAYEGKAKYLGQWAHFIEKACRQRGWQFVINPPDLAEADIIVAFRDGVWDGWMCRQWKSGVKIVNAMAAGRPIITQSSAAFEELKPVGSTIKSPLDLAAEFDRWASILERKIAVRQPHDRQGYYTLEQIASNYRELLEKVAC